MTEIDDNNVPEQTVQVSTTGEEEYEEPPPKPSVEVKMLRTELDTKIKELEETKKRMATLQEAQNIDDIPPIVDSKIVDNLEDFQHMIDTFQIIRD